jgi:hypothetical protein
MWRYLVGGPQRRGDGTRIHDGEQALQDDRLVSEACPSHERTSAWETKGVPVAGIGAGVPGLWKVSVSTLKMSWVSGMKYCW